MESPTSAIPSSKVEETTDGDRSNQPVEGENVNLQKVQELHYNSVPLKNRKEVSQGTVLFKLLVHSLAMFTIPFFTYYLIRNFAESEYNIETPKSFVYGAIGAVVVIQLIIASFVYQAFKEEDFSRKPKRKIT